MDNFQRRGFVDGHTTKCPLCGYDLDDGNGVDRPKLEKALKDHLHDNHGG